MSHLDDLDLAEETSIMVAYWRACESQRPDCLVKDDLALWLAETAISSDRKLRYCSTPLFQTYVDLVAVRTRMIDELLLAWLADADRAQIVNVGAGLDARPFRLTLPPAAKFACVDTPRMVRAATELFGDFTACCDVVRVATRVANLDQLLSGLTRAAFKLNRPVFWILEGFVEYLSENETQTLLSAIASASSSGSQIIVAVLTPNMMQLAQAARDPYFPWKRLISVDQISSWLPDWELTTMGADQAKGVYGRELDALFELVVADCR